MDYRLQMRDEIVEKVYNGMLASLAGFGCQAGEVEA